MIRFFDLLFSLLGLILLLPFFIVIAIMLKLTSKGPVFYRQIRVGKGGKDFFLLKFRTMKVNSDKTGLLTVGAKDPRVTRLGYFLRKYKIDELPQIFNVLQGNMSFVGPRPEVRKYVELYTFEQRKVLSVKPGITDYASIVYANENEILAKCSDPEKYYIQEIMPEKIALNMKYIENPTLRNYFNIIFLTLKKVLCR